VGKQNAYKLGRRAKYVERPRQRWKNIIRAVLMEMGFVAVNWVRLLSGRLMM